MFLKIYYLHKYSRAKLTLEHWGGGGGREGEGGQRGGGGEKKWNKIPNTRWVCTMASIKRAWLASYSKWSANKAITDCKNEYNHLLTENLSEWSKGGRICF